MNVQAKRIKGFEDLDETIICYWQTNGDWLLYLPKCGIGNLKAHIVTEHSDGTITVSPSILVTGHDCGKQTQVHGYLEHGIWRDC